MTINRNSDGSYSVHLTVNGLNVIAEDVCRAEAINSALDMMTAAILRHQPGCR